MWPLSVTISYLNKKLMITSDHGQRWLDQGDIQRVCKGCFLILPGMHSCSLPSSPIWEFSIFSLMHLHWLFLILDYLSFHLFFFRALNMNSEAPGLEELWGPQSSSFLIQPIRIQELREASICIWTLAPRKHTVLCKRDFWEVQRWRRTGSRK